MENVRNRIWQLGLMDPTDQEVLEGRFLAPRLTDLRGKVGGFLDNRKQNADLLLERIGARLVEEYGVKEAVHRAKFIFSMVADPAVIDDLAGQCDFLITGIGD